MYHSNLEWSPHLFQRCSLAPAHGFCARRQRCPCGNLVDIIVQIASVHPIFRSMPKGHSVGESGDAENLICLDQSTVGCLSRIADAMIREGKCSDDLGILVNCSSEKTDMMLVSMHTDRTPSAPTRRSTSSLWPSSKHNDSVPDGFSAMCTSLLDSLKRDWSTPWRRAFCSTERRARACKCCRGVSVEHVNDCKTDSRQEPDIPYLSGHARQATPPFCHFYSVNRVQRQQQQMASITCPTGAESSDHPPHETHSSDRRSHIPPKPPACAMYSVEY